MFMSQTSPSAEATVVRTPRLGVLPLQPQREGILWTRILRWQVCKLSISFQQREYLQMCLSRCVQEFRMLEACLFLQWSVQVVADGPQSPWPWLFKEARGHFPQLPGQVIIHLVMQNADSPAGSTTLLTLSVILKLSTKCSGNYFV